jgi:hypothetical protein
MRSGSGWSTTHRSLPHASTQPASSSVARWGAVSATVKMKAPEPAFTAVLRGPDGQTRRFPVEGGRASIHYTTVVVHPGQSVTINWTAGR